MGKVVGRTAGVSVGSVGSTIGISAGAPVQSIGGALVGSSVTGIRGFGVIEGFKVGATVAGTNGFGENEAFRVGTNVGKAFPSEGASVGKPVDSEGATVGKPVDSDGANVGASVASSLLVGASVLPTSSFVELIVGAKVGSSGLSTGLLDGTSAGDVGSVGGRLFITANCRASNHSLYSSLKSYPIDSTKLATLWILVSPGLLLLLLRRERLVVACPFAAFDEQRTDSKATAIAFMFKPCIRKFSFDEWRQRLQLPLMVYFVQRRQMQLGT